jgi:hypothetical protein
VPRVVAVRRDDVGQGASWVTSDTLLGVFSSDVNPVNGVQGVVQAILRGPHDERSASLDPSLVTALAWVVAKEALASSPAGAFVPPRMQIERMLRCDDFDTWSAVKALHDEPAIRMAIAFFEDIVTARGDDALVALLRASREGARDGRALVAAVDALATDPDGAAGSALCSAPLPHSSTSAFIVRPAPALRVDVRPLGERAATLLVFVDDPSLASATVTVLVPDPLAPGKRDVVATLHGDGEAFRQGMPIGVAVPRPGVVSLRLRGTVRDDAGFLSVSALLPRVDMR